MILLGILWNEDIYITYKEKLRGRVVIRNHNRNHVRSKSGGPSSRWSKTLRRDSCGEGCARNSGIIEAIFVA